MIINDYYEEEDHKLVDLERDSGLADEQLVSPGSHPEKKLLIGDASVSSSEDQSKRGHQVTRFSAKYRRITKSKGPVRRICARRLASAANQTPFQAFWEQHFRWMSRE